MFSDHFSGTILDGTKWSTCYHWGCTNRGNKELEWYQASQVTVHSGEVSLTAEPERTHGKEYVSGMLSSYGKFIGTADYCLLILWICLRRREA